MSLDYSIIDKYPHRLEVADTIYARTHQGRQLDENGKVFIAQCLDNTIKFLQDTLIDNKKENQPEINAGVVIKLVSEIVNVGLPQLVSFDLVSMKPMTSMKEDVEYVSSMANPQLYEVYKSFEPDSGHYYGGLSRTTSMEAKIVPLFTNITLWERLVGLETKDCEAKTPLTMEEAEEKDRAMGTIISDFIYYTDTNIVKNLINSTSVDETDKDMTWCRTLPIGVSKRKWYNTFMVTLSKMTLKFYDKTRGFMPNYILVGCDLLPVFGLMDNYTSSRSNKMNGVYLAGSFGKLFTWRNGEAINSEELKVYVAPNMPEGEFILGVNSMDNDISSATYALYLPLVPVQDTIDGTSNLTLTTMYDIKVVNEDLLMAGKITR